MPNERYTRYTVGRQNVNIYSQNDTRLWRYNYIDMYGALFHINTVYTMRQVYICTSHVNIHREKSHHVHFGLNTVVHCCCQEEKLYFKSYYNEHNNN